MMSLQARQPPKDQGDAAATGTDSTENGARSDAIAVQAVLVANQADTDDATQYILGPPAEIGSGNDGHDVVLPVQDSQDHDGVDFPSIYLCPFLLVNEPPVDGAYFDIPGEDGQISEQVFEYSYLFCHIATLGSMRGFQEVFHLLNGGWVSLDQALALVCGVPLNRITPIRVRAGTKNSCSIAFLW